MADNKKYLDLNGLGYTIRKMDTKKADIESPAFTGTPTASTADTKNFSKQIATTEFVYNAIEDTFKNEGFAIAHKTMVKYTTDDIKVVEWMSTSYGSNWGKVAYSVPEQNGYLGNFPFNANKQVVHPHETVYISLKNAQGESVNDSYILFIRLLEFYSKLDPNKNFQLSGLNEQTNELFQISNCKHEASFSLSLKDKDNIFTYTNETEEDHYFNFLIALYPKDATLSSNQKIQMAEEKLEDIATNLEIYRINADATTTANVELILQSPQLIGTPTANGEIIATINDINNSNLKGEKGDTPVITAEVELVADADGTPGAHASFYADEEELIDFTVMNGHKGERGISLLHVATAPWANVHPTPNNVVHSLAFNNAQVVAEAKVDTIYVGDIIEWNGFLYQIGYLGDPITTTVGGASKIIDVYVDNVGNIKGPQGPQGIQGEQGPQGPKGDPGEGFFIVTDEDYAKIADFVEEKSYHSYQRPNASEPIRPNIFYDFGPQYQLEIIFENPQSAYRSNEYMFQFESPADRPTTLIMPSDVKWCYDPVIEAGKIYQVSVLNNLAVICGA